MCSDKIFGKTIADFIKLKTFLEGNILGVKLMILDLKKTKIKKNCQFTFNIMKRRLYQTKPNNSGGLVDSLRLLIADYSQANREMVQLILS